MFDTGQKQGNQKCDTKTKGVFSLKNHRRVISLMLAIIMVLSMLPSAVFADVIGGNYGGNTSGNLPAGSAVGDWDAPTGTNTFVR